ncbi:FixH family protein [Mongoliitalea daihaiensis]|uniref:FixH family protein n=1 Tax=Mongoliitalea daihaiensis TaxID=2782006 RepID=UPI001F29BC5D|nr:FixH family protein [Mongoliitalea daihaiensis]UJP66867.1 FixH family protein [Mongoliitalea daihaiensis]
MDWGKGIILTLTAFAGIIISMVVICVRQDDIHLVTQNYYEEEIKYQDQIDKMINANQLDYEAMAYDAQRRLIELNLPKGSKGTLHLFRPSDARLDQKLDFDIQDDEANAINLSELKPGYWKIKMTWVEDETSYYLEKKINI